MSCSVVAFLQSVFIHKLRVVARQSQNSAEIAKSMFQKKHLVIYTSEKNMTTYFYENEWRENAKKSSKTIKLTHNNDNEKKTIWKKNIAKRA